MPIRGCETKWKSCSRKWPREFWIVSPPIFSRSPLRQRGLELFAPSASLERIGAPTHYTRQRPDRHPRDERIRCFNSGMKVLARSIGVQTSEALLRVHHRRRFLTLHSLLSSRLLRPNRLRDDSRHQTVDADAFVFGLFR